MLTIKKIPFEQYELPALSSIIAEARGTLVLVDRPGVPLGLTRWQRYLRSLLRAQRQDGMDRSSEIAEARRVIAELERNEL